MKSGVYRIRRTYQTARDCYIGSSIALELRHQVHISDLSSRRHHSIKLQRAWNKYGEDAFVFEVLLYCDPKDCLMYEQIALDHFKPRYNVAKSASAPMMGRTHTKTTKDKMRQSHLGHVVSDITRQKLSKVNTGNKNCLGRKLSKKTRRLLSNQKMGKKNPHYGKFGEANSNAKLTNHERKHIATLYREGRSQRELAFLFDVAQSTIWRILKEFL